MDSFFSEVGIRAIDFAQISTLHVLTLLVFFGARDKKWLNYFLLVTFVLQCLFFIVFSDELNVKLFAALMIVSTLTVEVIVARRRKLEASERSPAG
jgi:hypothetical protein